MTTTKKKFPKKDPGLNVPDGYGNLADLARRLGVTRARVTQLHKKGALGNTAQLLKNGYYIVDIDAAVQKLREYSDPESRGLKNKISRLNPPDPPPEISCEASKLVTPVQLVTLMSRPAEPLPPTAPVEKTLQISEMSFSSARTLKERYNAEMKKLDYEERSGKLLRDEDVQKGAFEMYRKTRDTLINIIDRISVQLAAENKEANIRIILENEIRNALTHIRDNSND
jgi:hypothetical protein